ncbi:MAG: hypothetical protein IJC84_01605 [Clostridia bacterium]|nr:hypothetical protein [Clostridia bacterium]
MKKILAFTLVLATLLSLAACSKEPVTEEIPAPTETAPAAPIVDQLKEEMDRQDEDRDLMVEISVWSSTGEEGLLDKAGTQKVIHLNNAQQLAPYRKYLPALTDADVEMLFASSRSRAVLVECRKPLDISSFSLAECYRVSGRIVVMIDQYEPDEGGESTPEYTHILVFIPESVFSGENIEVIFD